MSARLVGHVLEYYPREVSLGEFVLALTIADEAAHSGDNVRAAPSEIARLSRQSPRHVQRLLKKMVAVGWLQVLQRSNGGRGQVTTYQINPEWVRLPLAFEFAKLRHNSDTMSQFTVDKLRHHVIVSGPAPCLSSITPPLPPQLSESAVPSVTVAGADLDRKLADWMLGLIRVLHPQHREPNWKRWCREIHTMTAKGHTHREIAELFKWANGDDFWKTNILSPSKLWKQWDQLTIKRASDPNSGAVAESSADPLCTVCRVRPWSLMHGKTGSRVCGQCYDSDERRAA